MVGVQVGKHIDRDVTAKDSGEIWNGNVISCGGLIESREHYFSCVCGYFNC